jgi:regulatory protein
MNWKPRPEPGSLKASEALAYAIRALAARALTKHELNRKLRQRGASEEVALLTITKLIELKFLSDQTIAEFAARDTTKGKFAIKQKLASRGVSSHVVEDALMDRSDSDELENAIILIEKQSYKWTGARAYEKAYGFMMRRGFSSGVIRTALEDWRKNLQLEELEIEN